MTNQNIHASCVAFDGNAVLILGPSGSGKSTLALELIALGADLVADDRVILTVKDGQLSAAAPDSIAGRIEARFVGILEAPSVAAHVKLVVDVSKTEHQRIPENRHLDVMGQTIPLIYRADIAHFPSAIRQIILYGKAT